MLKRMMGVFKQVFNKEKKDESVNTNDIDIVEETNLVSLPEVRKATYEEYEESLQGIVEAAEAYESSLNYEEKQLYDERKEIFIRKWGLDMAQGNSFSPVTMRNRIKVENRKRENNKYLIIANRTKNRRIRKKNLKKYKKEHVCTINIKKKNTTKPQPVCKAEYRCIISLQK